MPILEIDGVGRVEVGNGFTSMSPQDQEAFVGEIVRDAGRGIKSSLGISASQPEPTVSVGEAMGRGGVQGLTMSGGDEMAGYAAASPLPGSQAATKTTFGGMGAPDVIMGLINRLRGGGQEAYTAERDRIRQANEQAQKERPYSYGTGELGGALATAVIPGTSVAKGASLGKQVLQGSATGAGMGAIQGAGQAKEPSDVPAEMVRSGLFGMAAGAAAPALAKGISRLVSPLPIAAERQAAVDTLKKEGVSLTAGQTTGSKALRWAESTLGDLPGSGGAASGAQARQGEQFTQAVMKRAGSNDNRATHGTIDAAFDRIGKVFDDVGSRNTMRMDPKFAQDIGDATAEYIGMVNPSARAPIFHQVLDDLMEVSRTGGALSGEAYGALRSRLDKAARSAFRGRDSDPQLGDALFGIRNALDGAFERSVTGADQLKIKGARREYSNLIPIAKASAGAGEGIGEGILSPAAMRTQLASQNRMNFARGRGDLAELTKAAQAVMSPLPNSGTAPRSYMQNMINVGGAGLGGSVAGLEGAALGLLAPAAAGRLLLAPPVQRYLANQAARDGLPALGLLAAPLRQGLVSYEHRQRQRAGHTGTR